MKLANVLFHCFTNCVNAASQPSNCLQWAKSVITQMSEPSVMLLLISLIYLCLQQSWVFVSDKPLQPRLMLASKVGADLSEASFRRSTLGQAPGLIHIHSTKSERPTRDKNSSLLRKFVNYGRKNYSLFNQSNKPSGLLRKFVNNGRKTFYKIAACGQCYKTFFIRD